jgi:hypothetical protein
MQHTTQVDRRQRQLLNKIRYHIEATGSYSDRALLALMGVARARFENKTGAQAKQVLAAVGMFVLCFVASLVPGVLTFLLFAALDESFAALAICVVVASSSLLGGRYGFEAEWRANLYRELRQLLTQKHCRSCGAFQTANATQSSPHPCAACGMIEAAPVPRATPPRYRHVANSHEDGTGAYLGIAELRHCNDAEAKAFVDRVNANGFGRAARWMGRIGAMGVIACVALAIAMILSTMTERSPITQIAAAAVCVVIGAGIFSLGRAALRSFICDLAQSALSPRHACYECGYPLSGLEADEHGLARCSECGLLVRPEQPAREPSASVNTKPRLTGRSS